jgi:site-specific DNA-cytosine methylase
MRVLIINSYAGSLLIAAKQEGCQVIASLEDKGYGIASQKLNYPRERYVDQHPWPDLFRETCEEAICLAHPPCSCFSIQGANANPETRGVNSPAFASSKKAIEYALESQVKALAVESVCATMEGAREYHDQAAKRHGYRVHRILLNAITFGVPQWRPRFWCLFVRGDFPEKLFLHHRPTYRTVGETLARVKPADTIPGVERDFQKWRERLAAHQIPLAKVLEQESAYGSVPYLAARYLGWELGGSKSAVEYKFVEKYGFSKFSSAWSIQLNPGGFTPTLMATSNWWVDGRPLTRPEYCAIAGFPTDYKFDKPRETQAYLSRGVAPPVARWILRQLINHVKGAVNIGQVQQVTDQALFAEPGSVSDFRVSRKELKQKKLFDLHREDS